MTVDPEVLVGIVLLLLGWIVLPLALKLLGLVFGATLGLLLVDLAVLLFPDFQPTHWAFLLSGLVFALLGMVMAMKVFRLLLFLSGFVAALVLKMRMDETFDLSARLVGGFWKEFPSTFWFSLLVALLGGLLLCLLQRYLIIALTSLAGAALVVGGTTFEKKWLVLTVVGVAFQTLCVALKPKRGS